MKKQIELYNKWLEGRTSSAEYHALQKEGMDNEFLGDAIEGIELYHKTNRNNIAGQLNNKIASSSAKRKDNIIAMYWPYAAAAGLALVVSTFFLFRNDESNQNVSDIVIENSAQGTEIVALQMQEEVAQVVNEEDLSPEVEAAELTTLDKKSTVSTNSSASKKETEIKITQRQKDPIPSEEAQSLNKTAIAFDNTIVMEELKADQTDIVSLNSTQKVMSVSTPEPTEQISSKPTEGMTSKLSGASKSNDKISLMKKGIPANALAQSEQVYPLIGQEAFKKILSENPIPQDALFMRSLKPGDQYTITFELDSNGLPINIDSSGLTPDIFEKIMKASGKWSAPEGAKRLSYSITLFAQ